MKIRQDIDLIYDSLYSYDISACAYHVLKNLGYDVSDIPLENKQERVIKIGLIERENPHISNLIRNITIKTIDRIIFENELTENDIIIRQFDGFFTTKPLKKMNFSLPLRLDAHYTKFIISYNRKSFIGKSEDQKYIFKGLSNFYSGMEKYLKKLLDEINFINIRGLFLTCKRIKEEILSSQNIDDFIIPRKSKKGSFIYIKKLGKIDIDSSVKSLIDVNEIDKHSYLNIYLYPFTKALSSFFLELK